ncbi:VanZ family protein [bacterium]|nr:VanZ family protein [bacterium]MBU1995090.1 VanZ family protein [bacterium]
MKQLRVIQTLFYVCLIVIIYLATTTQEIQVIQNSWDKLNHFAAFFVLYILMSLAYKKVSVLMKVFLFLVFAVSIETVQYFIPGREFSALDVAADMIGVSFAWLVFWKGKI